MCLLRSNIGGSSTTTQLLMDSVVLVLPLADFAAMYAAALRGELWQSGAVITAPLLRNISTFVVSSSSRQAVVLSQYEGWGWRGTNITLRPEQPMGADFPVPDVSSNGESINGLSDEGSSGVPRSLQLGVGLGVGLACTLVLAVAVAAVLVAVRMRRFAAMAMNSGSGSIKSDPVSSNADVAGSMEAGKSKATESKEKVRACISLYKCLCVCLDGDGGGDGVV